MMPPSNKDQIDRLSKENATLRERVDALTTTVEQLKSAIEHLSVTQGEATIRVEAVEDNLCSVKAEQNELAIDLTATMLRLEGQHMYSRKQTLLLTGSSVEMPVRGEDTRDVVLRLLSTHLGLTDINKWDISACHRLRNPKVILVRFLHLDLSDRVYRARTKPKRPGLLIFESLTAERLSVIDLLKTLKNNPQSPVLSYFTQGGRIYVRTSESRDIKPIEIPFGCGIEQIHELCEGKKVTPSELAIRDQFRAVHGRGAGTGQGHSHTSRPPNPWVSVTRGTKPRRGPPSSNQHTNRQARPGPPGAGSTRDPPHGSADVGGSTQSAQGTDGGGEPSTGTSHMDASVGPSDGAVLDAAPSGGTALRPSGDPPSDQTQGVQSRDAAL